MSREDYGTTYEFDYESTTNLGRNKKKKHIKQKMQ